jgi:ring-1,2-phenylacetyl-CoA epoxidase subunit PaaC
VSKFEYILRLGDDALISAQRLAEWCSRAPEMEEDIALANIALDQLGAARALLSYAGQVEGSGRTEDDLAYLRTDREFLNVQLVELDNGDFATTTAKLLFFAVYQNLLYSALAAATDETLAGIAGKAVKETAYHVDHAALWTLRLGDGTTESHRRMQAAIDAVWPYTHELFETDHVFAKAAESGNGVDPATLRDSWLATVEPLLAKATLDRPADGWRPTGGRQGIHTTVLSYVLAEMQVLHRAFPGAKW